MRPAALAALLEQLPDDALLPVSWLREHLGPVGATDTVRVDLTAEEVAEAVDRSPSTVRAWCRAGKLPQAYRLEGREWRIPAASLEAFLERQRRGGEGGGTGGRGVDLGAWRRRRAAGDGS